MTQQACQWRQTNDPYMPDTWEADCGAMWTFTDGAPKDNHMRFCPQCGHPLQQIDNAMNHKSDPYASEAETQALMMPDTRMKAERKLAKMMAERGADEQGAEAYLILRQIAVELLEESWVEVCCGNYANCLKPCTPRGEWLAKQSARMLHQLKAAEALAEQPAQQEPVACIIGTKGSAFDLPTAKRAYTYAEQPGNVVAYKIGRACEAAMKQSAWDGIDRGLAMLQELQKEGLGVFDLGAEYAAHGIKGDA